MGRARDMRLLEDERKIQELSNKVGYFQIRDKRGLPPTEYVLDFCLSGYLNKEGDIAGDHLVRLSLPERYPFSAPPKFSILRGLFHPNVYKNGDVCHGWFLNNWHPAIHIDDLILDVAKMIAFKDNSYNLKSPANYDCDQEWIESHRIPLDETMLEPQQELQAETMPASLQSYAKRSKRRLQKIRVDVTTKPEVPTFGSFKTRLQFPSKSSSIRIHVKK